MTNADALLNKGRRVRVSGYRPQRFGTIVGFEFLGRKRPRAMYVLIDCGESLGTIGYKAKYLSFTN